MMRRWHYDLGRILRETGFLLSGRELRVVKIGSGGGLPFSAFERVELRVGEHLTFVHGPADLVGHVRVASPQDALQYVRVFTSPATARAMRSAMWVEVVPMSAVDPQFVFGRDEYVDKLLQHSAAPTGREFGVLTDDQWREAGLVGPTVVRADGGFIVVRLLFRPDERGPQEWWTQTAHWVAERVTTDGRIEKEILGDLTFEEFALQLYPEK
jgi:hypothetical protein